MGIESKNSTSLPRHVYIADGGMPNLPPSEGTDDDVVVIVDDDSYQEQDAAFSRLMYDFGNISPATIRGPIPLIEPVAMQAYFNWYDTWRMAEIITVARNTEMSAFRDFVLTEKSTVAGKAATNCVGNIMDCLRIPLYRILRTSVKSGDSGNFFGSVPHDGRGTIKLNPIAFLEWRLQFAPPGKIGIEASNILVDKKFRSVLAHELTHLDHIGEPMRKAQLRAIRKTGVDPFRHTSNSPQQRSFDQAYFRAFDDEISKCRERKFTQIAIDRRNVRLGNWRSEWSFVAHGRSEQEARTVGELVENPDAATYTIVTKDGAEALRRGVPEDECFQVKTIPTALQHPERYESRFLNPGWKDVPFRFAYNLANNRAVLTAFRSAQIGLGALSLFDIASAVSSTTDPTEDRLDATLAWTNVLPSVGGASLFTYGMLAAKPFFMLAAGIPAAGSVLLIGGKHLYDDVRDYEIVSGNEIAASSFETIGGAMALGGAIAIFMTGGTVIPIALFFGGIALALGSGMAHNEAEEDRVARQIWDAIISGNFAALAGLSHDAHHEFDDDAVVDLFENYFIPQGFLAPDIWKADELKYLREKIIKELGGEDFFSYMGDDEAAYRLFAALNESEEEAMMVAKQMDRSDWEAFDTFRKAHVPSLVVPASVEAVRK